MNAIFQVIQNLLRRKKRPETCPHCGKPMPWDLPDPPGGQPPRCPSCGQPLTRDEKP